MSVDLLGSNLSHIMICIDINYLGHSVLLCMEAMYSHWKRTRDMSDVIIPFAAIKLKCITAEVFHRELLRDQIVSPEILGNTAHQVRGYQYQIMSVKLLANTMETVDQVPYHPSERDMGGYSNESKWCELWKGGFLHQSFSYFHLHNMLLSASIKRFVSKPLANAYKVRISWKTTCKSYSSDIHSPIMLITQQQQQSRRSEKKVFLVEEKRGKMPSMPK